MIPTDERTADRWLRKYPNSTIFTLLGVMVLALVLGAGFFMTMRPKAGGATHGQPEQPMQTTHPQ